MTAPTAAPPGLAWSGAVLSVSVTDRDDFRSWTLGSLFVTAAAAVFAVLGVPRLPLMWPLYRLGVVLPGCGLTRGVVAFADGDLVGAWRWNPASPFVVLTVAAGIARAGVGAASGRWLAIRVAPRWWLIALGAAAIALLWVNQWAHASLLMDGR